MQLSDLIYRVRIEIGDPLQNFNVIQQGDGVTKWFDLPKQNIDPDSLSVTIITGVNSTSLVSGTDYVLNSTLGEIQLTNPVPAQSILNIQGSAWGLFSDDDLILYLRDAVSWHVYGQSYVQRYRNVDGWITFRDQEKNLENLPQVEEILVIMRATIVILWVLANDAATDPDVTTSEGTELHRSQRYAQLMQQIEALTDRYYTDCMALNVGPYRVETGYIRRVSKFTGRLVPLFRSREYDDHRYPDRLLPEIDGRDVDNSGVPSPLWQGQGY